MATSDDVIALVHDLSSAGLAVTLIGAPIRTTEGSKSSGHLKSSEQCNSNNPTRERAEEKPNMSQDCDIKKQRYSSMSAEVCPTRDREVLQKKLAKKIDVRYLNEIKSFKDKIKSSYLLSCNQTQCPMIQERLNQHQMNHHHIYRKDYACGTRMKIRDQAINVSPTLSRMRLPKFTLPIQDEGRQVQTEITMRDFSPNRLFRPKPVNKITSDFMNREIPLRKSETREVLPKRNFYKEHLQNEILNWLHQVPMFYSLNFTTKDIKDNIVNNLAEKINTLSVEAYEKNYELKTKIEIDNCLSRLPMWLHGSKRDQILFKDGLREKLWNKIQGLNENFLGITYEKAVGYENLAEKVKSNESYEKEVVDWSLRLQLNPERSVSRRQVVDLIMKRLSPLLKIPLHTTSYKLILKGEIIDILDDLPLTLTSPRYKTVQLNRFAEELANRLLSIQIKRESSSHKNAGIDPSVFHQCTSQVTGLPMPKSLCNLKDLILNRVGECLDTVPVCHRNDLKKEICSTFLDSKECLRTGNEMHIKDEICQFLRDTGKLSGDKTQNVAKMIINQVKDAIKQLRNSATTSFDSVMPQLSGTLSVYRWGTEKPPVTSTPKRPSRKEISKLSSEERSYMENVAALIRIWMDTLPKQYNDDLTFKDTIINDLAGDIMDYLKVEQLAPDSFTDKDKYLNYIMYRWLYRFNFFDDSNIRSDAKPLVADFLKTVKDIPVPNLTAPQHGTRQAMEHIKHMEGEHGWEEDYVPKGTDVLEDQISVWMNEQPSEIYSNKDKGKRNKMVHDLALNLQDRLRNKSPESEIDNDINQWLKKVVHPKEKEHIGLLTQDLKEKIIHIPQDQTLQARHEERKRDIAAKLAAKRQMRSGHPPVQHAQDVSNVGNIEGDPDRTIREFIGKYMEHYYDIDDPMARGAFAHLLKTELRKLTPPTRKEVYEQFEQSKTHDKFRPENLNQELEYIKIISDWLKNIPIEASYNTPGNKRRIEFINDLAKNIQEIEEQKIENPDAVEYNYLTASMILQSMHTYGLPILPEHKDNTPLMVEQLLQKLADKHPHSSPATYESQPSSPGNQSLSQSLNASDIKEQNLSEFITDYIRVNGREIADDELKLEAWTARLLKEIKKMIQDGADPATLTKAQVYEKFAGVPIPTEDAVERYGLEIYYVKEITDWMKNLPLLPIENQPEFEEERIKMISELSEMMCDTEAQRRAHPTDKTADKKLEGYIASWISRLPLDKSKEINLPILIQQLMSRLDKGSRQSSELSHEEERQTSSEVSKTVSDDSNEKKSKHKEHKKSKSMDKGDSKHSVPKRSSRDKCPLSFFRGKPKTPAEIIVEAIENWSNKLPIKGDDKEAVKSMKEGIARKLYQKTGELNVDPRIFNDDLLYREMLGDEIDTQLENVPQNPELQKNREKLKEGLLNTIIDTNKIIKQRSAGDNYRHKLETTIDASIPNPVQSTQAFDPGFEIYKNHLADMFILENFDHANDDIKANYEKRIRQEIDKYFESAQNKNALPLTKDQIYNEIYSALFKVPMPHENSVIDEIEQIKTRCEIDAWYDDLPIEPTDDINELLERDKILSTLAKKIHEIEKYDSKVDDNIFKEISKWLEKLPLTPGHEGRCVYAKRLQTLLKSTASARKYVPPNSKVKGKSKQAKEKKDKKGSKDPNTSQVPGPSGALQSKATNAKPCLLVSPMTHKKPGDIIVEVVEEWCNQLPLISTEENNKVIRDNISTRIIIQISELNMDSEIFNDDVVYDELLDEELENVMSNLPVCCDFAKSKPARKYQLKEIIKSIKPLIKEEKARHEYKEELNSTVANILKEPLDTSADKLALFNKLKEDIVENFVQYNYNRNDEEGKQVYKNQVHDAVVKYCIEVRDKDTDEEVDPLVRRNQLLCELEKIPVPHTALKEEVAEIKMKKEVDQFLREQSIPEGVAKNKVKKHLAKRLCDIERSGYSSPNEKKMKSDIIRCLKKLKTDVRPSIVDAFVNKLKNNEAKRKTPPMTSSQAADLNQDRIPGSPGHIGTEGAGTVYVYPTGMGHQKTSQTPQEKDIYSHVPIHSGSVEQWVSSLPETPYQMPPDTSYYTPYIKDNRPEPQVWSPHTAAHPFDQSLGQSNITYDDFEGGNLLSSSVAPQGYAPQTHNLGPVNGFGGRPSMNTSASYGRPSRRSSQKSMSKSYQQGPRVSMREVTSGPMLSRPSFGQIATPRQVAQSPRAPHSPSQSAASPGNSTPDSLFQAPVFKPVPLHRPLPVPIIEPVPLPGSAASMQSPRRSLTSPDNALVPSPRGLPMQAGGRPMLGDRRPKGFESTEEEEICICERCTRRNCRGIPFCMLAMEQYFEECFGIPMFCGMHFPECYYF